MISRSERPRYSSRCAWLIMGLLPSTCSWISSLAAHKDDKGEHQHLPHVRLLPLLRAVINWPVSVGARHGSVSNHARR